MPAASNIIDQDVVIVGGGFGGCYLLHLLREKGFSTVIIEASGRLGGVWATSCYPGARVDVELYFEHVDDVWQLSKDVVYNTIVTEAVWQQQQSVWLLKTSDGQQYRCKWFLAATGTSYKKNFPAIEGLGRFKGAIHHSAAWPEEGISLDGKRVAIIGAGSTGIQVLQEAAKVASQVTQFIRSPNYAVPMRQREISEDEIYANKSHIQHVFNACRTTGAGLPVVRSTIKTFDHSPEERQARWEETWKQGGFNWGMASYADTGICKDANNAAYQFWRSKVRQRVKDPKKADILAPEKAPYCIGTKRPSLEQDYYEMADQDNVDITDTPVAELVENGIRTDDEQIREFDVIAICTGYDAVTGGLRTMGIKGRDGIDLDEKWRDGVVTDLGMIVNGYPNFAMVYGPQAPTSLSNGPPFIEMQCEWIRDVLVKQREEGIEAFEAKKSAEQAWRKQVLDLAEKTLFVETNSWYMGANVKGKQREMLLYLGGIPAWWESCQKALDGWADFETHKGK